MDLDPELLKELIETFKIELEEQAQVITDGLLQLEKLDVNNKEFMRVIEKIFRAAHNVKGAARGIGVVNVGEISHHLENLFSSVQKKNLKITPEIIDLSLDAVDKMRIAMDSYVNNVSLPFDLKDLLNNLSGEKFEAPRLMPEIKSQAPVKSEHEVKTQSEPRVEKKRQPKSDLTPVVEEESESKAEKQDVKASHEPEFRQDFHARESIRVSIENLDRVSALMEEIQVNKIAIDEHYSKLSSLSEKTKQLSYQWKQARMPFNVYVGKEVDESLPKLYHATSDAITEINSLTSQLHKSMRARINELAMLSNSLQEEIRMLRLIPASTLLRGFPRAVRDLANDLGKQVALKITGDDVKMDKMVLEGLRDPLMHLLRNAIDHGIGTASERKKENKSEVGNISINIIDEGNQILIEVKDDGVGIDVKKIAKIAEQKNIISHADLQTMSDNDILELIFRPGFSTKEIITSVSGRGVGLDVVKSNIADLKGNVSVRTEVGKGTTFYCRVPLTLSSERGLMISSGGQVFVVPTNMVERVLALEGKDIIDIEASQAILLDNHPIPLHSLADILNLERKELSLQDKLLVIVIKQGWHTLAILIDEIIGEREIVIKPLQAPLVNVLCVAGGTLSSSGQVIIVLNVSDVINTALRGGKTARVTLQSEVEAKETQTHILVVDDSITTRTLEQNILENKGYKVTVAVNGKEAWDLLQKQKFSLTITDINMPVMDGFTLTEKIKKNDGLKSMPVIIVTSLGSDAEKKRGVDVGANAYIVKNEFESGTLLDIVAQLV